MKDVMIMMMMMMMMGIKVKRYLVCAFISVQKYQ